MSKATKKPKTRKRAKKKGAGATKRRAGRPSTFTQALADEICRRLSEGEALRQICRDDGMPDPATVWRWEEGRPEFVQAIARAREAGYDAIALEALAIADDGSRDYKTVERNGRTEEVVDHDHIQRSKLRVDTRLKLLSKWSPRYSDKIAHTGPEGEALTVPAFVVMPVAPKDE